MTVNDTQHVSQDVSQTGQQGMNRIQHRCHEQEGEFDRLGDTGQEGGQGSGGHDTNNLGAVFRLGSVSDGKRSSRQTEHLEQVTTGQLTEAVTGSAGSVISSQEAGHDAVYGFASGVDTGTRLIEEGDVPDVVQTERDQGALDHAVDTEGQYRVLVGSPVGEGTDGTTDRRPDEGEHNTQADGDEAGDDGHGTLTGEEAKVLGQLDLVETVERPGSDTTGEDTPQHTGIYALDAHHRCHDLQGRDHDAVADDGRQTGYTVVIGKAKCHADGEQQGHLAKH